MSGSKSWMVYVIVALLVVLSSRTEAGVIYSTSFESSQGYVIGNLNGQDGWDLGGIVQSSWSSAGSWGMEIVSWSGSGRSSYYGARRVFSAPTESLPLLTISQDVMIPGAPGPNETAYGVWIRSDTPIVTCSVGFSQLGDIKIKGVDSGYDWVSGQWKTLTIVLDYENRIFDVFYGGQQIADDVGFTTAGPGFGGISVLSDNYAGGSMYHDNLVVTAEPLDTTPPVLTAVEAIPNPAAVLTAITVTATADDSERGCSEIASAQYQIDGGDWVSMDPDDGDFDEATEQVSADLPIFSSPGVYVLSLRATDASGNVSESELVVLAVYDPEGRFVTGGGWIHSAPGAYVADPNLQGKATFGFVSKYKKGASIPTGQTEFRFQVADLDFHSYSYDWLVVAGPKAQFKGEGAINNAGTYGFMLTATDGALPGGGGVDKFRIKIWDKASTTLIYDNQMGAEATADPATELGGGSIVIHKEKKEK